VKLTKADLKLQRQVLDVLNKDNLNFDDIEYIYGNLHAGMLGDVTNNSAYFTPLDLAYDFGLFCGRNGIVVDMCAGIGILSFAVNVSDYYRKGIKQLVCIERNPDYIKVGKKLLPEADWIQGDIFDKEVWDNIIQKYGKIDSIISNPPFGKVTKTDCDRSWLKYTGSEIDMAAIEIAYQFTNDISMILPAGSVSFRYSGRPYYEEIENRKVNKLKKDTGLDFMMTNPGIDTTAYEQFRGTKILVEYVDFMNE
jgi:predicted RNA methylase